MLPEVLDPDREHGRLLELQDARVAASEPVLAPESAVLEPARPRAGRRSGRSLAGIGQLGGLAFALYLALFNLSVVRGSSMTPGIHDGDRILVDPLRYLVQPVRRGDVVVLKYPLDPSVDYIKRVIGLPGDMVVIDVGRVWVNGVELVEPYVEHADLSAHCVARVEPAHYFVLGDNRPRSSDSREFGQVPQDYVRGKVELRVWPLSRVGEID